jgi:hypothetical protein
MNKVNDNDYLALEYPFIYKSYKDIKISLKEGVKFLDIYNYDMGTPLYFLEIDHLDYIRFNNCRLGNLITLPKHITNLEFNKCNISFLSMPEIKVDNLEARDSTVYGDLLFDYTNIVNFIVDSCRINISNNKSFYKKIKNVKCLRIENSNLENLSKGIRCMRSLEEVYLANNKLRSIYRLSHLKNLKKVHVENNNIKSLPEELIKNNKKLTLLNLSDNNIQKVDRYVLRLINMRQALEVVFNNNPFDG